MLQTKRTGTGAAVSEVNDDTSESWCAASADDDVLMQCEDLFQAVINCADPAGRLLYLPFQTLPSKKVDDQLIPIPRASMRIQTLPRNPFRNT